MERSFVIGVLTHNRISLLTDTLESLLTFNPDISNLVLVDSDSTEDVQRANRLIADRFGMRYVLAEGSSSSDKNVRIEHGVQRLIEEVLQEGTDICCLLQDDWRCMGRIPVDPAWELLNNYNNIGQIRMRDFRYDDTFDGGSSVNFVTHRKIEFKQHIASGNVSFGIGELHWVDSCNLMLSSVLSSISKPFDSEIDRMISFHSAYPCNAQLQPGIFHHIGPWRVRQDLREKGLFNNACVSQD